MTPSKWISSRLPILKDMFFAFSGLDPILTFKFIGDPNENRMPLGKEATYIPFKVMFALRWDGVNSNIYFNINVFVLKMILIFLVRFNADYGAFEGNCWILETCQHIHFFPG